MKLKFNKKIICIFLVILIPLLILLLLKNKESFSLGGQGRKGRNIKRRLKKSKTGRSALATADKMSKKAKKEIKKSETGRSVMATSDKMSEKARGMITAYSVGKARMKERITGDRTDLNDLANQMISEISGVNATIAARNMRLAAKRRLKAKKNISVLTVDELLDTSDNTEDLKSVAMNIELNNFMDGKKSVNKRLIRERLATLAEQAGDGYFGRQNFAGKLISRTKAGTEARLSEVKNIRARSEENTAEKRRKAQAELDEIEKSLGAGGSGGVGRKLARRKELEAELEKLDEMEPMRRIGYNAMVDRAQQNFDERQKLRGKRARNRKNSKNFERTKIVLKRSTEAAKAAESAKAVASVPIPPRRRPAPIPPGR